MVVISLVLTGALFGCGQAIGDHSEKVSTGKVIVLFQIQTLPGLDGLANAIRERPSLRGTTIHLVTLPLDTGEQFSREVKKAMEQHDADVYFTQTSTTFRVLKELNTAKKPVVFLTVTSLQDLGLTDADGGRFPDLNHVTGVAVYAPAHAKHVETLRSAFPRVRRVGVLVDGTFDTPAVQEALRTFRDLEPVIVQATRGESAEAVRARIAAARADAWYFPQTAYLQDNYKTLIPLLRADRVRALYGWHFGTRAGGTLAMQAAIPDRDKRSAEQIELILSGTPPAQIAIETASVLRVSGNAEALSELGDGFDRSMLRYIDFMY